MKAIWNGQIIAESSDTVVVETNHYFPPNSIKSEYFQKNDNTSICAWKGEAKYYDIIVEGKVNPDAAWYYPEPSEAANNIKDRIAFWRGVKVVE